MECVKGRVGLAAGKRQVPTGDPVPAGRAPLPRGIEGTQTGRILLVRNVTIPLGSSHEQLVSQPQGRAHIPSGRRMSREANAGRRKETGNRARRIDPSVDCPDNRPDTGGCAWPERELTRDW
jgi:hypothetical protein